jgi:hypothetical protein
MENPVSKLLTKQYVDSAGWADWIISSLSDDDLKKEIAPVEITVYGCLGI